MLQAQTNTENVSAQFGHCRQLYMYACTFMKNDIQINYANVRSFRAVCILRSI